jgi:D-xylose transport system ATP-binding protein
MPDERGTPLSNCATCKAFGGIRAVDHVTFDLYPGEVMGVLGHNGAGKSVLMKMLSGALQRDSGRDPHQRRGSHHQQPPRRPQIQYRDDLPDARAGRQSRRGLEPVSGPRTGDAASAWSTTPRWRRRRARSCIGSTRTSAASRPPVSGLSGGQRQSVAIARAVYFNAKILIMDEPTAALGPAETQMVAELIEELKKSAGHRHLPDRPRHPPGEGALRPRLGDEERQLVGTVEGRRGDRGRHAGHDHRRQMPASGRSGARRACLRDKPHFPLRRWQ